MTRLLSLVLCLLLFSLADHAFAQDESPFGDPDAGAPATTDDAKKQDDKAEAEEGSDKPAKPDFNVLPEPFDKIEANVTDLEKDGLFKILEAKFDYIGDTQDVGLTWTLQVRRPITYRRALYFLHNFRDARFYYRSEATKRRLPVYSSVLEIPSNLSASAAQRRTMIPGEKFVVWVPLTDLEQRQIKGRDANRLQLGRPTTRYARQ